MAVFGVWQYKNSLNLTDINRMVGGLCSFPTGLMLGTLALGRE